MRSKLDIRGADVRMKMPGWCSRAQSAVYGRSGSGDRVKTEPALLDLLSHLTSFTQQLVCARSSCNSSHVTISRSTINRPRQCGRYCHRIPAPEPG